MAPITLRVTVKVLPVASPILPDPPRPLPPDRFFLWLTVLSAISLPHQVGSSLRAPRQFPLPRISSPERPAPPPPSVFVQCHFNEGFVLFKMTTPSLTTLPALCTDACALYVASQMFTGFFFIIIIFQIICLFLGAPGLHYGMRDL